MPYHSSDSITVALEIKLIARKRLEGLDQSIPVSFNSKENQTIKLMVSKHACILQKEIEEYIKLSRKNNDKNNNRANRCRANTQDTSV